ncbi:MAG: hypothetical protein HXY27_03045 [Hydrogenophilaceae bacterium]|nr:hypothetical protein [Hydrogenophilaceae bacterium]
MDRVELSKASLLVRAIYKKLARIFHHFLAKLIEPFSWDVDEAQSGELLKK